MILALDIGTSFLKGALIDVRDGSIVRLKKRRFENRFSDFTNTDIWLKTLSAVLLDLEIRNELLDCIIVSGNGPTLAPSCGGKVYLYTFSGATEESEIIKNKLGIDLIPSMFLPKALYIKNHEKELWKKSRFFMSSPEYISYVLTGSARTILTLEGLEKWYWNNSQLDVLGIEKTKFPPFIRSGELLGKVSEESSRAFGIKEGTPVLAGCPDFVCAIIGSGAMHSGMICNRSGSSEGINYCSEKPVEKPFYMCYRHPNNVDWNISAVIPRGFLQIDTVKNALGFEKYSYSELFDYLKMHNDDSSEKMKEACFNLCREIADLIKEIANGPVQSIRVTGAPSKYDFFNQLRANATGVPVYTVDSLESGLSGLGIMAISALTGEEITKVSNRVVVVKNVFNPE